MTRTAGGQASPDEGNLREAWCRAVQEVVAAVTQPAVEERHHVGADRRDRRLGGVHMLTDDCSRTIGEYRCLGHVEWFS
jgi:hypothetical protein